MRRIFTITAAALLLCPAVAAYNPPPGGVRLENITSPAQLSSASSCAGGALFLSSPSSITVNPAIISDEQRITLDAGYTALISFGENFGSAFELGGLLPTKWCCGAALLRGAFTPFDDMDCGNTLIGTFALGKRVLERLRIGASATGGMMWSAGWSYMMTAGAGAIYDVGDAAFLSGIRFAASITDIGRTFSPDDIPGIDDSKGAGHFPLFFTPRGGAAATLFEIEELKGGISLDTVFPGCQNFVLAAGYSMAIYDKWTVSISQTFDVRELSEGCACGPAISVGYKMLLKTSNSKALSKGWGQNDMMVSTAWQSMYGGIQALSAGAILHLGQKDTEGPEIVVE